MSNTTDKHNEEDLKPVMDGVDQIQDGEPPQTVMSEKKGTGAAADSPRAAGRAAEKKALRFTSLTAIIVTVILMIAAILTAAGLHDARAAEKAKNKAEAFSETLLNTLQTKGQERVEQQFWNGFSYINRKGKSVSYEGVPFNIVDNYEQAGPADQDFQIYSTEEDLKLPETGKIQRYTVLGALYKGTEYDVQIQYDPSGYGDDSESDTHAYNVNNFPDTKALTSETTAIINPEGAYVSFRTDADGTYEYDNTSQQFKSETKTLENSALENFFMKRSTFYEEAVAIINSSVNETEIHNWHKLIGTAFYDNTDKSQKKTELKKNITRNTAILAQGGEGSVRVTSSVIFKLTDPSFTGNPQLIIDALPGMFTDATVTVMTEDEEGMVTESEEPVPEEQLNSLISSLTARIQALYQQYTAEEAMTEQFMVYESDHPFLNLENIYLMYYPLRNGEWKSDTISIDISEVSALYRKEDKLNLYVVPQLGLLASSKKAYASIQASEYIAPKLAGGNITYNYSAQTVSIRNQGTLFDLARIRVNYVKGYMRTLAAADMRDSITEKTDPEDILYTLQVNIYKASDGRFPEGDYLAGSSVTSS